jgi:hypothetical protein
MIERTKVDIFEKNLTQHFINNPFQHAVWGAIFAGVVMVIVIELVLALLGAGIGLGTINPTREDESLRAIGIGALMWWMFSGVIALYFGGWLAARMAAIPRRIDGVLHGLLTWGVSVLIMFLFLTSTLGALIGGGFGILKASGQTMAQTIPEVRASFPSAFPPSLDIPVAQHMQAIQEEIRNLLQQRRSMPFANLDNVPQTSQPIEAQLMVAVGALALEPDYNNLETKKRDIVNMLISNTTLSPEAAKRSVDRWAQEMRVVRQDVQEGVENIAAKAQQVAESTSDVVGKAALASFFMLVLGGAAAAWGGRVGTPHFYEGAI